MPAKKDKNNSSKKKVTAKKPALKKLSAKNNKTAKKPVVKKVVLKKPATKKPLHKKVAPKKVAPKKVALKKVVKAKIARAKIVKAKLAKVKAVKVVKLPQKKKLASKPIRKLERKLAKKSDKHSLVKAILAKGSTKEKSSQTTKVETEKSAERKFESSKRIILVRKSEDNDKLNFKVGDYAIYPSHGVGKIVGVEKTIIAGHNSRCYLMNFEREKLTIKIPVNSSKKIGLRHLITKSEMDEVFVILRSGIKKLKGMWSRRAQEYETKINSGDIILLAEVIRDLTRDIEDAERSYSERIIYETAIYRLASEYTAIYKIDFEEAKEKIITTAKDKLTGEIRFTQKDDFDDFDDFDGKKSEGDEDEEESDDEDDKEEDDDFDFDYENDKAPRKKMKKK